MKRQNVLNKNKKKKGFTLIELIIVMAIMAILAVIAIPKFTEFKNTANKKHDVTTGRTIANVVNTLNANGSFSGTISGLDIADASDPNAKLIAGMLENGAPKAKTTAVKDKTFFVTIDSSDKVTVTTGDASDPKEVYPTPDDIFK